VPCQAWSEGLSCCSSASPCGPAFRSRSDDRAQTIRPDLGVSFGPDGIGVRCHDTSLRRVRRRQTDTPGESLDGRIVAEWVWGGLLSLASFFDTPHSSPPLFIRNLLCGKTSYQRFLGEIRCSRGEQFPVDGPRWVTSALLQPPSIGFHQYTVCTVLSFGTGTFGGGSEFFRAWGSSDVAEANRLVSICL